MLHAKQEKQQSKQQVYKTALLLALAYNISAALRAVAIAFEREQCRKEGEVMFCGFTKAKGQMLVSMSTQLCILHNLCLYHILYAHPRPGFSRSLRELRVSGCTGRILISSPTATSHSPLSERFIFFLTSLGRYIFPAIIFTTTYPKIFAWEKHSARCRGKGSATIKSEDDTLQRIIAKVVACLTSDPTWA